MEVFVALMNKIDSWIWGLPMLVLLCGTHIFMTFRTGFIQRKTLTGIRLSVTKDPDSPGDVSQFQALTTALASTSARATSSVSARPSISADRVLCCGAG